MHPVHFGPVLLLAGCASLRPPPPVEVDPAAAAPRDKTVLVVYDVEDEGAGLADADRGRLSAFFRGRIGGLARFQVVPDEKVRARLAADKRAAFAASRDEATQIELGRAVSASHILRPTVLRIGEGCTTSVALYDLEAEARVQTVSADGACDAAAQKDALAGLAEALATAPGVLDLEGPWRVSAKTMLGTDAYTIELMTSGPAVEGSTGGGDRWQGRLDGRVLTATWQRNGSSGRMRVTFSKDGQRFTGAYGLGQGDLSWPMEGRRVE